MGDSEVLDLQIDLAAIANAKTALRRFSPAFQQRLLPRLTAAGEQIATDTRRAVMDYPVHRNKAFGYVRDRLAEGIEVSSYSRADRVGVRIISTGKQLPVSKQALVKAWNLSEYRHPNFGRSSGRGWSSQAGARYFSSGYVLRRSGMIRQAFDTTVAEAIAGDRTGRPMTTNLRILDVDYDLEDTLSNPKLNILVFMAKRLGVTLKTITKGLDDINARSSAAAAARKAYQAKVDAGEDVTGIEVPLSDNEVFIEVLSEEAGLDVFRGLVWLAKTNKGERADGRFLTLEEACEGVGFLDVQFVNDDIDELDDEDEDPADQSPKAEPDALDDEEPSELKSELISTT